MLDQIETASLQLPLENIVVSQNLSLAASILIILFWNFFANRIWTYNDVPVPRSP
jgi:putative flippase GtrA